MLWLTGNDEATVVAERKKIVRHEGSGMISAYVDYSGPERRNSFVRKGMSDRRAATP